MSQPQPTSVSSTKKILLIIVGIYGLFALSNRLFSSEETNSITKKSSLDSNYGQELIDAGLPVHLAKLIRRLRKLGGIGTTWDEAGGAEGTYASRLEEFRKEALSLPDSLIDELTQILESKEGGPISEYDRYLAIHLLTQLPADLAVPLLKEEVLRPLPAWPEKNDGEISLLIETIMARKFAAIESLTKSARDFVLDLIESPQTRSALKRVAVQALILTDIFPLNTVKEIKPLLKHSDYYMIAPFIQPKSQANYRAYFLGKTNRATKRHLTGNPTIDAGSLTGETP